jgi:hypothetical protein
MLRHYDYVPIKDEIFLKWSQRLIRYAVVYSSAMRIDSALLMPLMPMWTVYRNALSNLRGAKRP